MAQGIVAGQPRAQRCIPPPPAYQSINEPGLIGTIRPHSCYGDQEPYSVAVLNVSDSTIAEGIELLEPER